uniref:Uncharacterized protein n=1 Tax=Rhizophora mucronata TaxID=61149 RepID=A0A2P2NGF3_RHIMU
MIYSHSVTTTVVTFQPVLFLIWLMQNWGLHLTFH